ncbi:hypothetical protein [Leptospira licerasiae]|uniref:hypothetical protein n=1 Tax=Leptospira licerasiae TaxID=447106 RepID=UPI001083210C|nr:hypothetical protein [Leptospira licerasiae]TGM87895.1 hypothetical protein EHR05_14665 [Leptospira licerasiae]
MKDQYPIYYKTIRSLEEELEDLYNAYIDQAKEQYGSGDELSRRLAGDKNRFDDGRKYLSETMRRYRRLKDEERPILDLLSEICKKIADLK